MAANAPQPSTPAITLPSVIHYLQTEFSKYERDRNYWELERAEMKARIAKLEGERKATDRMKDWYERRLRMLEQALHEERLKSDPEATSSAASNSEHAKKKSKHDKHNTLEHDEAYLDMLRASQEVLKEQAGRQKSKTYLEKCLLEVTYLVSALPAISANQAVVPDNEDVSAAPSARLHAPTAAPSGPRLMRTDPVERVLTPNIDALPGLNPPDLTNGTNYEVFVPSDTQETTSVDDAMLLDNDDLVERIQHTYDSNGNYVEPTTTGVELSSGETERANGVASEWYQDDRWDFESIQNARDLKAILSYRCQMTSIAALCCFSLSQAMWLVTASDEDASILFTKDFDSRSTFRLETNQGPILCLTYSIDEEMSTLFLYSAGEDASICKWSIPLDPKHDLFMSDQIQPSTTFISHSQPVCGLICFEDHLISASRDGSIRKWQVDTGDSLAVWWPLERDKGMIPSAICRTGSTTFAVGYEDGQVRSFDITADKQIGSLRGASTSSAQPGISCLATTQAQKLLIGNGGLHATGLDSKDSLSQWHDAAVKSLSVGSRHVWSGHAQGTIKSWSSTGEELQLLKVDTESAIVGLACIEKDVGPSPILVAACADGTIQVFGRPRADNSA